VRVVDESLPADGGAWFLEVDPHDDLKIVAVLINQWLEFLSVVDGGGRIVDRARADHDEQAVVLAFENGVSFATCGGDKLGDLVGDGLEVVQDRRGNQGIEAGNAEVVGSVLGHRGKLQALGAGWQGGSGEVRRLLVGILAGVGLLGWRGALGVEARGQRPETRDQRPEARGQRPETRDQRPETRDQRPEARGQRPETRGQRPEARGRLSF